MATYDELRDLFVNSALKNKIEVAVVIAAHERLTTGSPTEATQKWASNVLANPSPEATKALRFVLAAYNDQSTTVINGASDSAIQTAVNSVVDSLIIAFNAV